jgi:PEP-CTERM motif
MFMHSKGLLALTGLLFFGLAGMANAPAYAAGLDGSTVQSASYLGVSFPPPAASPTECTVIFCNIIDYQGPSGPTNSPLPTVPVTYLEDSLTATTASVGDTKITITNDMAGLFCPPAGCTAGEFSGYVFTFTGAPDITKVMVDSASSPDFPPVLPGGLSFTATSITVNVNGDNLAVGDQLILDVTTKGNTPVIPEPSTWAMLLLGFAGLGFVGYRRKGAAGRAAHTG